MKTTVKLFLIMLVLLMAAGELNAQRGMRGAGPDSARFGRQGAPDETGMHMRAHANMMRQHINMWHAPMYRMHPGMAWGPGPRRGRGFGPQQAERPGFSQGAPGFRALESIPDLTEKQKSDIGALRKKHQEEMQKFREENDAKAKSMRESQRKSILNLLTDEQKKYLEDKSLPAPTVKK